MQSHTEEASRNKKKIFVGYILDYYVRERERERERVRNN